MMDSVEEDPVPHLMGQLSPNWLPLAVPGQGALDLLAAPSCHTWPAKPYQSSWNSALDLTFFFVGQGVAEQKPVVKLNSSLLLKCEESLV